MRALSISAAAGATPDRAQSERPPDDLIALLLCQCHLLLTRQGYRPDGAARSCDYSWVRYCRRGHDRRGEPGAMRLLILHDVRERAVMLEQYFTDDTLGVETPYQRQRHAYAPDDPPAALAGQVATTVAAWLR
jgi:hypothetical protein